jgi:protoporphyrinogen IX oxidase
MVLRQRNPAHQKTQQTLFKTLFKDCRKAVWNRDGSSREAAWPDNEESCCMSEWIKALHVLAVISWMAGMLYLPRLFVYHAGSAAGSDQSETFKIMERRLLKAIMTPAMLVAWSTGLWLAWSSFAFKGGWLHWKLASVVILTGVHGHLAACVRRFAADTNQKDHRYFRILNEIPTLLMIVIVILVIVKPF